MTEQAILNTEMLPRRDWTPFYDRLYVDKSLKERIVKHGELAPKLKEKGIEQMTASSHGVVLLSGPPGTGKTTLAKGAANEIAKREAEEIVFKHVRIDLLGSSQLGATPQAVGDVFERIRTEADRGVTQVVLLDEVESLFSERADLGGDTDPEDVRRAVNTGLDELDLLSEYPEVFVIATSNQPGIIDRAFLSRCDQQFEVAKPGPRHRGLILADTFSEFNRKLGTSLPTEIGDVKSLVEATDGLSGRKMKKTVRNSFLQGDLVSDPSRLTYTHVCDEFREGEDNRASGEEETFEPEQHGPKAAEERGEDTTVKRLNPRQAVQNFRESVGADGLIEKLSNFFRNVIGTSGETLERNITVLLDNERVRDALFELVQMEALERVEFSSPRLKFHIDIAYETGPEEHMEPPRPEHIPKLREGTLTLLVNGDREKAPELPDLEAGQIRLTTEPNSDRLDSTANPEEKKGQKAAEGGE